METDMTVNAALLRQTLDYIKAHPQEWDQTTWREITSCGTVACFAGWACALNGDTFAEALTDPNRWNWDPDVVAVDGMDPYLWPDVEARARAILGLTETEADWLFDSDNGLDELEQIVENLCRDAS